MGEIAQVVGGGTPSTSVGANFENGTVPWVTPADLSGYRAKYISKGARNITETGLAHSAARVLPAGCVLLSSRAPIGYVAIAANPLATNQGFKSFSLTGDIRPDWVYYYLLRARTLILEFASGTTFLEVSAAKVAQVPIPLAPLLEQDRIVSEIEKQFTRLDAAAAALKRVQANLKRYRAAVLSAACKGRLVPTETELARREGGSFESGSSLLSGWLMQQAQNTMAGSDHAKGRDAVSRAQDSAPSPLALPEGWTWARVGSLLRERPCNGLSVKASDEGGVLALRLNAMADGGFDYSKTRYLPVQWSAVDDLEVRDGDFFVSRGNVRLSLVGRGTLAQPPPFRTIFPDTMIRLRLFNDLTKTKWVSTIWPVALVRRQIESKVKTTAGIWKINQPELMSVMVPLPPLAEQRRIVREVERQLSLVDGFGMTVNASLRRATVCRQAILASAFSGKLVQPDPAAEPANVLLERIQEAQFGARRVGGDNGHLGPASRRQRTSGKLMARRN